MWEFVSGMVGKINIDELSVDQAYLNITSHIPQKIWMYSLSEDCIKCPYSKFREIGEKKHILAKFSTSRHVSWKFFDQDLGKYILTDDAPFCSIQNQETGEFGIYNIDIFEDKCDFEIAKEPVNIHLSLLYAIAIVGLAAVLLFVSNKLYKKYVQARLANQSTTSLDTELDKPKNTKPRLKSLDTFRGIAIALMIFVNSGGGHYWWMDHATWNGLHVADLLFPWFLWIMGVCIPMSIKSQVNRNVTKGKMIKRVLYRSIKLFLIGLCLNTIWSKTNFIDLRIMGVLQRFGIAYFVVTTLHILLTSPIHFLPQSNLRRAFYDMRILIWQWIVMGIIIIIYLAIMFAMPVPGCPTGYLGPGGKHEMGAHPNCIGGATGYIDRVILGERHLYQHGHAQSVYDTTPFDPEGLFGCLTTFLQVFLGVQCGMIMIVFPQWQSRVKRWLLWAIVTGLIAGGLSSFTQDDGVIPINKHMWSLSFTLATSSLAFILLTFCYLTIDVKPIWSGTPFFYAGMNAIILYIGHSIAHSMLPFHWSIGSMNTHFALIMENIWCSAIWVLIAYVLYRKKIFYTV